ncbi:MAG: alpha/beta hydrolase [Rhodospirillales bacterium]|jgi:epsilon-lactone hydrolase|nr:alpha/beta hydrolase [Rhodospirillales bacterium]MBT4039130.1 alpha/beta hydrolase [Rhodospirillales bacterium]MBT4625531.1 alpha/beta hydrolase [Rhodospirillales bacterium]MBT5352170.1 alpha/beta hydrolase [Rhodospirillales bacterium]MBT5520271.1 alpha/beta hydrolase [Rhodospirillales bacterium]
MKHPAPKSISTEAQAFIASAPPLSTTQITADNIQMIRDEVAAGYKPTVDQVCKTYDPTITEISIAGVPVQKVQAGPDAPDDGRVIFYIFGGGFVTGDPTTDQIVTVPLAHKTGATVYAPHYRLAPEHLYPAATDDCFTVYKALLDQVGADRIAISGESAGGNLALSVMSQAHGAGLPLPLAAALFSPFGDFTLASDTLATLKDVEPTLGNAESMVATYTPAGQDMKDPTLSPLYADFDATWPPTLFTTGTRDLLLSESARLSTAMRQAGVDVSLHVWEGMWHVFEFYPQLPEAQKSLCEVADFLNEHFG